MRGDEIKGLLAAAFPDADVTLQPLADDDDHWSLTILSPCFAGQSRVVQHQRVYAALGERVGNELHALQLRTGVPAADPATANDPARS